MYLQVLTGGHKIFMVHGIRTPHKPAGSTGPIRERNATPSEAAPCATPPIQSLDAGNGPRASRPDRGFLHQDERRIHSRSGRRRRTAAGRRASGRHSCRILRPRLQDRSPGPSATLAPCARGMARGSRSDLRESYLCDDRHAGTLPGCAAAGTVRSLDRSRLR